MANFRVVAEIDFKAVRENPASKGFWVWGLGFCCLGVLVQFFESRVHVCRQESDRCLWIEAASSVAVARQPDWSRDSCAHDEEGV